MRYMKNFMHKNIVISGVGVTTAFGQGQRKLSSALMEAGNAFGIMQRPGRQNGTSFIGAEMPDLVIPDTIPKKSLRSASLSAQAALVTLFEAWNDARLDNADKSRVGLIVGGSNLQQRELMLTHETYKNRAYYIPPTYGFTFMDTDICGLCSEIFGIKGSTYSVGGASASGQLSIIQALHAVRSGQVDVCIAMGALMDVSFWECQALRSTGAMAGDRYPNDPDKACRPFDRDRDGFVYGESCGAVVIESAESATNRGATAYAKMGGWAMVMDCNRNPNPSYDGEVHVIKQAIETAELKPRDIDYVNPHGTGSLVGDETEIRAIVDSGLGPAYINATKSIVGHGLSAAGTVEVIATLIQMREGKLHPTRNLENPIDPACNWVPKNGADHSIRNAVTLSYGFGGINTALCLQKI
jgi:malonyl-ACP decarboxylase